MKIIARVKMPKKLSANIGELKLPLSGGFEEGYKQGREDGYAEGEKTAAERAEAHNAAILTDCNAVLPTKGVETAETLEQVPQRIEEIQSYSDGYDVGLEAGKKAEYDAFWKEYQKNGKEVNYRYYFAGLGWNDLTYKPKYPFGKIIYYGNMYEGSGVTDTIYPIDLSEATITYGSIFNGAALLITIKELIVNENIGFTNWFAYCNRLKNIIVSGIIGQSGFDIHWSAQLTKNSIKSIIDALSVKTNNLAVALSILAVNTAFETSPGAADGSTSDEWTTLIATKPNWTISLV